MHSTERTSCFPCFQVLGFITCGLLGSSLASLTTVAINRYLFICKHSVYKQVFTHRTVGLMLFGCWLYGFLTFLPALLAWGTIGYVPETAMCGYVYASNFGSIMFVFIVAVLVPMTITYVSYGMIAHTLWRSKQKVAAHTGKQNATKQKGYLQIRTMFIVSALFTLFWVPFSVVNIIGYYKPLPGRFAHASAWLGDFNSCVNCIVLGLVNKKYRAAYRKVFCCICKEQYNSEQSQE